MLHLQKSSRPGWMGLPTWSSGRCLLMAGGNRQSFRSLPTQTTLGSTNTIPSLLLALLFLYLVLSSCQEDAHLHIILICLWGVHHLFWPFLLNTYLLLQQAAAQLLILGKCGKNSFLHYIMI